MNLWEKHPLAIKHQIGALNISSVPYTLNFVAPPSMETLNQRIKSQILEANQLAEETGSTLHMEKSFSNTDLQPHRVGVSGYNPTKNQIQCFPISWAQYTTMRNPEFRATLSPEERFHCLSMCALAKTSDNKLILSTRSKKVSIYAGMLHVSAAGFLDLDAAESTQQVTFQFFKELEEELGVLPSEVKKMKQLGLVEHLVPDSASVEICLYTDLFLTGEQVVERSKAAKDSWEGKVAAYSIEEVTEMVGLRSHKKFNPSGAGTIMMVLGLD